MCNPLARVGIENGRDIRDVETVSVSPEPNRGKELREHDFAAGCHAEIFLERLEPQLAAFEIPEFGSSRIGSGPREFTECGFVVGEAMCHYFILFCVIGEGRTGLGQASRSAGRLRPSFTRTKSGPFRDLAARASF